jgi:alkanesulfonate monooxygenase SsuD/methylene tetrahydromethanopterin reductase-like flavin-dependent oxidoreductase (luciferase family)
MLSTMPAVSLVAVPGRRKLSLELAVEIERLGFVGVSSPSMGGDQLAFLTSLAHVTSSVWLAMNIQPIYFRGAWDLASTAAYLHEITDGRFTLGLGVSHGSTHERLKLEKVRPVSDMRTYIGELRAAADEVGGLPPVTLAALRDRMVDLSVELTEGVVWANASLRYTATTQLARVPEQRRADGFVVGNVISTVIDEDPAAAAGASRQALRGYIGLPAYRSYWSEAGYAEEMAAIEAALAIGDEARLTALMTDEWLADVCLYGTAAQVREQIEAWVDAGVTTPILVPWSSSGSKLKAFEELFAAYS